MSHGFTTKDYVVIGAGALAMYLLYRFVTSRLVTEDLNPASHKNIASRASDSIVETVTGEKGATLGNKIYDWLNPASKVRIEVFYANGDVRLANGQTLRKGWSVTKEGLLIDADGTVLGRAG